jgi:hypothetical protein
LNNLHKIDFTSRTVSIAANSDTGKSIASSIQTATHFSSCRNEQRGGCLQSP